MEGYRPFQVVGVDFAWPITSKIKENKESKADFILFCDNHLHRCTWRFLKIKH